MDITMHASFQELLSMRFYYMQLPQSQEASHGSAEPLQVYVYALRLDSALLARRHL